MGQRSEKPDRKPTRLPYFDYSTPGAYFITGCCVDRKPLLGKIRQGRVKLSRLGALAKKHIQVLGERWACAEVDIHVVMPNHFHFILWITPSDWPSGNELAGNSKAHCPSASRIVGLLKAGITREARKSGLIGKASIWQRSFYDHVIRDELGLNKLREYIINNPLQWELDRENPEASAEDPIYEWWEGQCINDSRCPGTS